MTLSVADLLKLPTTELSANVSRYHNPNWAWAPVSGEGASRFGGRFNPKGLPALYTSLDPHTAFKEAVGGTTSKLIDPMLLCTYQVNLSQVIDLTPYRQVFDTPWRQQLLQGVTPPGHALAKALLTSKLAQGVLVPSYAAPQGSNLVCYQWDDGQVQLYDPDNRLGQLFGSQLKI